MNRDNIDNSDNKVTIFFVIFFALMFCAIQYVDKIRIEKQENKIRKELQKEDSKNKIENKKHDIKGNVS